LSKSGSNAARLTGVLCTYDPVERLHRDGATVALARVATVAWPPCLGAGAVAQGAGSSWQAKSAEVHMGLCRLWSFTAPPPCRGCAHCRQGVARAERTLHKKRVFLMAASGVHSSGSAMGNCLQWWQPLIVVFGGVLWWWCTVGTGTSHKFLRRVRHGSTLPKPPKR
jgi:hypothetical protein